MESFGIRHGVQRRFDFYDHPMERHLKRRQGIYLPHVGHGYMRFEAWINLGRSISGHLMIPNWGERPQSKLAQAAF